MFSLVHTHDPDVCSRILMLQHAQSYTLALQRTLSLHAPLFGGPECVHTLILMVEHAQSLIQVVLLLLVLTLALYMCTCVIEVSLCVEMHWHSLVIKRTYCNSKIKAPK